MLKQRHYVTTATTSTHWYDFYPSILNTRRSQYGDNFCLVLNCSRICDEAYILPFTKFAQYFSPEYLKGNRWFGHVRREYLTVEPDQGPIHEVDVGPFYNAFELLQDAPQPIPARIEFL